MLNDGPRRAFRFSFRSASDPINWEPGPFQWSWWPWPWRPRSRCPSAVTWAAAIRASGPWPLSTRPRPRCCNSSPSPPATSGRRPRWETWPRPRPLANTWTPRRRRRCRRRHHRDRPQRPQQQRSPGPPVPWWSRCRVFSISSSCSGTRSSPVDKENEKPVSKRTVVISAFTSYTSDGVTWEIFWFGGGGEGSSNFFNRKVQKYSGSTTPESVLSKL